MKIGQEHLTEQELGSQLELSTEGIFKLKKENEDLRQLIAQALPEISRCYVIAYTCKPWMERWLKKARLTVNVARSEK